MSSILIKLKLFVHGICLIVFAEGFLSYPSHLLRASIYQYHL